MIFQGRCRFQPFIILCPLFAMNLRSSGKDSKWTCTTGDAPLEGHPNQLISLGHPTKPPCSRWTVRSNSKPTHVRLHVVFSAPPGVSESNMTDPLGTSWPTDVASTGVQGPQRRTGEANAGRRHLGRRVMDQIGWCGFGGRENEVGLAAWVPCLGHPTLQASDSNRSPLHRRVGKGPNRSKHW